ncbi:hypothetical protein [Methylobacterium brachiatum]
MDVLSIQSHLAYSHVSNASVVFPMQRLRVEMRQVHTAPLSDLIGSEA